MTHETQFPYTAFREADREWSEEIERAFPKEWPGDVRYTPRAHGEPGTVLRAKYDAWVAARDAWHALRLGAIPAIEPDTAVTPLFVSPTCEAARPFVTVIIDGEDRSGECL